MSKRKIFTTKNIARMAIFTALAYILYMPIFEFSLIPAVPFLKIDFSNAFVLMAGFALGPIPAIIVCVLKEVLHALTFSSTVGIGELANILIALPLILIPSCVYRKHRNFKAVCISLAVGCVAQSLWSILVNYTLSFPFFWMAFAHATTWKAGMDAYLKVWYWALLFNFVKSIMLAIVVLLLYKNFQRLFALMFRENVPKKKKGSSEPSDGEKPTEEPTAEPAVEDITEEAPIAPNLDGMDEELSAPPEAKNADEI